MKRILIFALLLFLCIGVVSASEDINDTLSKTPQEPVHTDNTPVLKANETSAESNSTISNDTQPAVEKPTLKSQDITSKAKKTITLKTIVKNSKGPLKGVKVTFNFNKKTYTAVSDASGVASVKVKCPNSAVLKTVKKTKGNKETRTTYYSKTYTCTVTAEGVKTTFKVISKKNNVVKKYKIAKKTKVITLKMKNGEKFYKRNNYAFGTVKVIEKGLLHIAVMAAGRNEGGYIKFFVKDHIKKNGKWKWDSWLKIPKNNHYYATFPKTFKIDKVKVKYTHKTYTRIK